MFAPLKQPTVLTTILPLCTFDKCGDYKKQLYILRTLNRPPKGFKDKFLEAINFNRNDSVGIAIDLINFEKLGVKFNGIPENLEPTVFNAYSELKNNPLKVNDYSKLDRASRIS